VAASRKSKLGFIVLLLALGIILSPGKTLAAGVTVITHGFNANVTDWVIPMCNKVPQHAGFPGTNFSIYEISITRTGSQYFFAQAFLDGVSPAAADSGEIIIALDWSTLSGGNPATTVIATQAVSALLSTNLIPDLSGKALAELPLHFVGHSRGGSVITEMARVLGAQGIWVDQVTTLDPHPVSQFGDPPVTNYSNILFADNYWQNLGDGLFVPNGQSVAGAYNRQLTNLDGGYSSSHSDMHLWYHGTIDLATPASDTQATITSTVRQTWWTGLEAGGTNNGFLYSLVGGGNRFTNFEPAGAGKGRISDGYNKSWDIGAGVATNRSPLPSNNGAWPNLLRLDVTSSTNLSVDDPIPLSFYHQYGSNTAVTTTVRFFLDADANPYNGNETEIFQGSLPGTGTTNVPHGTLNLALNPHTTAPGTYRVFGRITAGALSRYLYAPQKVVLSPSRQAPLLTDASIRGVQFHCTILGFPGQTVAVQASTNLIQWTSLQTNTISGSAIPFQDPATESFDQRYYRALLLSSH
jgi:hypothetical protein